MKLRSSGAAVAVAAALAMVGAGSSSDRLMPDRPIGG